MLILILIDVQYWEKDFFSFEKDLNYQNHFSSGFLHRVNKIPPSKSFDSSLIGGGGKPSPNPYGYLENSDI